MKSAIVNNEELAQLRHIDERGFKSVTLPMLFDADSGGAGLARALEDLQRRTSEAVEEGYTIIILSDRGVNMKLAPIPSLLATAGVHHHLVREGTRNRAALVIETRRSARGASPGAADRLWRRRRQSVSGVRDARRHDPQRHAARA